MLHWRAHQCKIRFVSSVFPPVRDTARDARALTARIVSRAYWPCPNGYARFSRQEVDAIACKTVHLTNHHIKMLKWDQLRKPDADDFRSKAEALMEERETAETIKAELPMFACLPDEQIDALSRDGRLLTLLGRHLAPDVKAEPLDDCEH